MPFLYLVVVKIVSFLLPLAALFSKSGKISDFINGRRKPYPLLPAKISKRYWFHCASLGEFEQARPVMEQLKSSDPGSSIVITFFSPSGYNQKKDFPLADAVIYLPLDTPSNARKLIHYLQPDAAIFVKYEIWYFHLKALFDQKIPVYLISASFRSKQFLFSAAGRWLFKLLPKYHSIFLQDQKSYELLKKKGLKNIIVSGDTRYDRVKQNALNVTQNAVIKTFKASHPLLIMGSSWPEEEDILLHYLETNPESPLRIVIAPHDISQGHIDDINKKFKKYRPTLYTDKVQRFDSQILVLNTIGHLASAYTYADLAFVGGAFGKGLHNILEPLAFGAPVIFGPHYAKYPEAYKAIEHQVGISIKDQEEFAKALDLFSRHENVSKCIDFINQYGGATDLVVKKIKETQVLQILE
jgi:3-deoxy-D-manno-octulosonic-acid transferase